MSIRIIVEVWELDLPPLEKLVLLALADHANSDGGSCYPGVDLLAQKTGLSRRTVQRILRKLETKGIAVPVAHQKGGSGLATEYQLNIEKRVRETPIPIEKRASNRPEKGVSWDEKGVSDDLKGRTVDAPTVINRKEPPTEPAGVAGDSRSFTTSFHKETGKSLSISEQEEESARALISEYGHTFVWRCWMLFLKRTAGFEGLLHPLAKFVDEFDQHAAIVKQRAAVRLT